MPPSFLRFHGSRECLTTTLHPRAAASVPDAGSRGLHSCPHCRHDRRRDRSGWCSEAAIYGATVVLADRWYPSSKTCSCCGSAKAGLALSERVFRYDGCSMEIDRDLNAARNLDPGSKFRAGFLAASSAVSACGEVCSGASAARSRVGIGRVKQALMKQEPDGGVPASGPGQAAAASHRNCQLCIGSGERLWKNPQAFGLRE